MSTFPETTLESLEYNLLGFNYLATGGFFSEVAVVTTHYGSLSSEAETLLPAQVADNTRTSYPEVGSTASV